MAGVRGRTHHPTPNHGGSRYDHTRGNEGQAAPVSPVVANHLSTLMEKQCIRHEAIMFASFANRPENIGYDEHQLRPGKIGQWDMYDNFMAESFSEEERMLVCAG